MTCDQMNGGSRSAARSGVLVLGPLVLMTVACGSTLAPDNGATGGLGGGAGGVTGAGGVIASGGTPGSGGTADASRPNLGAFTWSIDGQSFSTDGYYDTANFDGSPGGALQISSDYATLSIPCNLRGNFASLLPPPGTYPIAAFFDTISNGTFIGLCSDTHQEGSAYGDYSSGGQVTLTKSEPDDIEGTFTMLAAASGPSGTGGQSGNARTYTGEFAVRALARSSSQD
jgi:hypothetical protein